MSLSKLLILYNHYKINYDFQLSKMSYKEVEKEQQHDGEFIRDDDQKGGILWRVDLVQV